MEESAIRPVGHVRTCYPGKFGVPRQAGLVPAATAELHFVPECRRAEAVRGLEGFSHLWLLFQFHLVPAEETRLSVRPPRLGGNERVGVFATRSPFRPNRIGLSAVRLERMRQDERLGPVLELSGVDLVDGTPVFDVKPYLPYADALPEAAGGFAGGDPQPLPVVVSAECRDAFDALPHEVGCLLLETLSWDPRPAYHEDADRRYSLDLAGCRVTWSVHGGEVRVLGIS